MGEMRLPDSGVEWRIGRRDAEHMPLSVGPVDEAVIVYVPRSPPPIEALVEHLLELPGSDS